MLDKLKEYYNQTGKSPKRSDFPEFANAARKNYGSWSVALQAAGIPLSRHFKHDKEDLLAELKRFYNENGRSPSTNDCSKTPYLRDSKTYIQVLKCTSWSEVLRKAGLKEYYDISVFIKLSDHDLLLLLKTFFANKKPTTANYNKLKGNLPSLDTIRERFGGWNNLLAKLDILPNQKAYSRGDLIENYLSIVEKLGKVPSITEFITNSSISVGKYRYLFGSWRAFLIEMGHMDAVLKQSKVTESNEELKQMYINFSKKHGYENGATATALNASDEIYSKDVFTKRFMSINNLRVLCGFKTQRPRKQFDKTKLKNDLNVFFKELNHIPNRAELSKAGFSAKTLLRYFESKSVRAALVDKVLEKQCLKCDSIKPAKEFFITNKIFFTKYCRPCFVQHYREIRDGITDAELYAFAKAFYEKNKFFPGYSTRQELMKELGIKPTTKGSLHTFFKNIFEEVSPVETPLVQCSKCLEVKPFSDFTPYKGGLYGATYCKSCINNILKDYREKHPEKVKIIMEKVRNKHLERSTQQPDPNPE